jgi:transposase
MLLTKKEKTRLDVIQAVTEGSLEVEDAARLLDKSARQIYRLLAKAEQRGPAGVLHASRGRTAHNKGDDKLWAKIIKLASTTYRNVNDRHLQEILARDHAIHVNRESLRQRLRAAGLSPKRTRRKKKYRSRRQRKAAFGMMLQIDASPHDWLEGRGPYLTLVGVKDDATGYAWCRFVERETTWAYLLLMREVFLSHGLPLALYSDRHTIFHSPREPTIIEQLNNQRPLTQFGRAMDELGIHIIKAYSPQAKGRVERHWGILQDRLVVELRLAGAQTRAAANPVLDRFLKDYNARFTIAPQQSEPVFRPAPGARVLDRILCLKETRVVHNDHTVSFAGLVLQIPRTNKYTSIAKQRVEVLQLKDGTVEIVHQEQTVARFTQKAIERLVSKSGQTKGRNQQDH